MRAPQVEIYSDLNKIQEVVVLLINIASNFKNANKVFLLRGDIASGKTSLVQFYTAHFYPNENVTSPTFSLMHQYKDIFHYDFYQRSLQEVLDLGLLEWLEVAGVHFVEWGESALEKLLYQYGYEVCLIEIIKRSKDRIYRIYNEQA